jgi:hypothetical protein
MAKVHLEFSKKEVTKLASRLERYEGRARQYKALYDELRESVAEKNRTNSITAVRCLQEQLDSCKQDVADRTRERDEAMNMADRSEVRVGTLRKRLARSAKALSATTVSGRIRRTAKSMIGISTQLYKKQEVFVKNLSAMCEDMGKMTAQGAILLDEVASDDEGGSTTEDE